MSLQTCIPGMVQRGEITPEKGEEMASLYGELEPDFRRQFGDQAAAAMATDATLQAMEAAALRKKRLALGAVQARKAALAAIESFNGGRAEGAPIDPRAAVALFAHDGRATYSNAEGRMRAIRARARAMMDGVLATFHTNVLTMERNKALLGEVVREAFGEDTGNAAAKELAQAWARTAEMLRQRFNAAGGHIGKIERWGLPQAHDTRAVRAAGYDAWRDAIAPQLDRDAMVDQRTGQRFSDEGLELALREVWETIRTDGWNGRGAGAPGKGALANQRADHRFLIFKDAASWQAYQERFGVGSAFDAMMGHIDGMARDIALMEVLGPNPNNTVQWLKDTIEQSAALASDPASKASDRAFAATRQIDRLYDEITGAAGRPENRTIALGFSALRSLQTAAKLGSATLSAVTDTAFQFSTRRFNGLATSTILPQYLKLFRPGAAEDQRLAVRLTGIAEEWSSRVSSQGRYLGEELTSRRAQRLAEGVLRVSLLSRWTEAGRWAFGMEFLGHITDQVGKGFDGLDPAFRRTLERYGIGADGWDAIRKTPLTRDRGADWLRPQDVENQALSDRLYEMILTETDYAVPTADLRTRAMFNSVAPKGTWAGEIARSALLFKGFGVSVMAMHGRRILEQSGTNAARYAAGLFIGTMLTGALALQLKAIAGGRDPRPTADPKFAGAAILQGGGFGIFGDFLQSQENRFGGGFAGTLAGPLIQDAQGVADVLQAKHPAWKAARLARQELPGGSLWYARLAFDRMVADQIQQQIDPDYRKAWRRMAKRAADQRTRYYWAPGDTSPERAPDFANALEGAEP